MRLVSSVGQAVTGVALAALAGSCIVQVPGPGYVATGAASLEVNVNRPGGDYRNFDLASGRPEECRDTCGMEPQCVAFTFVNPGVQGPSARCWLKGTVPDPTPDACCVSGVKNAPPPVAAAGAPPPAPMEPPPPAAAPPPQAPEPEGDRRGLEHDVNRPGGDYTSFDLPQPHPHLCQEACMRDGRCQSFTYVKPGMQGPRPRCWLKGSVPAANPDRCCVSGVKGGHWTAPAAAGPFEMNVDRPGYDFQNFDLPQPRPELCRESCLREGRCQAFTYVNPGVQGPNARCWLKMSVPPATPNNCCISGVK
ncbi:MAG TPA: PAN domain-containing protein [Polyangia bacterium]|nr:PAN domain-containing protein [Polyangia bacterium]